MSKPIQSRWSSQVELHDDPEELLGPSDDDEEEEDEDPLELSDVIPMGLFISIISATLTRSGRCIRN